MPAVVETTGTDEPTPALASLPVGVAPEPTDAATFLPQLLDAGQIGSCSHEHSYHIGVTTSSGNMHDSITSLIHK